MNKIGDITMIFTIIMKTPDCVSDAIDDVLNISNLDELSDYEREEKELELEDQKKELEEFCERWFQYGECIELEMDTVKKTCKVVESKKR
jgi:hypothetical protein